MYMIIGEVVITVHPKQQIYEAAKQILPPKNNAGFLDNLLCGMLTKSEDQYRSELSDKHIVLCVEYGDDHVNSA